MQRPTPTSLRWPMMLAGILLLASAGHARFAAVDEPVPVERLVQNVGRYVKEHPDNARGHYTLGRIHSLAFAQDTPEVRVMLRRFREKEPLELPGFAPYQSIQVRRVERGPLSKSAREHLTASLREYAEATRLTPKDPLAWMGRGWMLEQGAPFAEEASLPENFPKFFKKPDAGTWRALALEAYRQAYALSRVEDLMKGGLGPAEDTSIALEAGEGILRLLVDPKTPELREELTAVKRTVDELKSKPRAITPVIFSLQPGAKLDELLDPARTVSFDLGGAGRAERWPWVRPDTYILAWDPEGTGQIRSGRQLFGSVTWSMFWADGYAPLAALDDNGDGSLTGEELQSLVVWQDQNGNAVSDPGEVTPLAQLGVRSLAVRPGAGQGLLTRDDGTPVRTYDWVPVSRPAGKNNIGGMTK